MADEVKKLSAGDTAPTFSAQNEDDKTVTNAGLAGKKAVIYFFPAAGSPGCTKEAVDLQDNLALFKKAGYQIFGVSPDKPKKLKSFVDSHELQFSLLSDPELEMHKAWGAFGEKSMYGRIYKGSLRSTFAIDETGKVTHALYNVKATGHAEMLKKQLGIS